MIANFTPNKSFSVAEKFMAEKLLELFFSRTLDSHRAKLNNPRWALIELHQVLSDWHHGKIKSFDKTIRPVIHETLKFIEEDNLLNFKPVEIKYYKELLGKATDEKYHQLSYATKILIDVNQDYYNVIFSKIQEEIKKLNAATYSVDTLKLLSKYLDYLATDLINNGYAKQYLYSVVSRLFSDKQTLSFPDAFEEFKKCITREKEDFTVIFKLNKLGGGNKKIDIKSNYEIDQVKIDEFSKINIKAEEFFSRKTPYTYFLAIDVNVNDYLSAIEKAKRKVFTLIDLIHMGYPDNPFDFSKKCLVIGSRKPELTNSHPVFYTTDGYYKNNEVLYDLLLDKIKRLEGSNKIQKETVQKMVSAFRHLRLGRDADELEQKFLNYWIGLEYVFSNYEVFDTTINRLKEYFTHSHANAYLKRNLAEFHKDLERLKLLDSIPNANENLEYLKTSETYDFIIDTYFEAFPLLAFRAYKYKSMICDSKISGEILKHRTNLEWHLTRCYRIRNEIVHDAAIHLNIESITGNLKYYLTYILNGLLDYLDNTASDINMDGMVTITDYFLLQEIKYNSLKTSGFDLNRLMEEKSATEIFSR